MADLPTGSCQDIVIGPSSLTTVVQKERRKSQFRCPRYEGLSTSVVRQVVRGALSRVGTLLDRCRPTDVPWFVPTIIVDAINRVRGAWTWADVIVERLKTLNPLWTDRDSPVGIVWLPLRLGIEAACLHVAPRRVLRSVSKAVLGNSCLGVAAAGFCLAVDQAGLVHNPKRPTPTATQPQALLRMFGAVIGDRQPAHFFTEGELWVRMSHARA